MLLDVGCGTGSFAALISERCAPAEIQGIDPSEGQLAAARMRPDVRNTAFLAGDAMALPFPQDRFDAAVGWARDLDPPRQHDVQRVAGIALPEDRLAAAIAARLDARRDRLAVRFLQIGEQADGPERRTARRRIGGWPSLRHRCLS